MHNISNILRYLRYIIGFRALPRALTTDYVISAAA
jgi:hypothetical protein